MAEVTTIIQELFSSYSSNIFCFNFTISEILGKREGRLLLKESCRYRTEHITAQTNNHDHIKIYGALKVSKSLQSFC